MLVNKDRVLSEGAQLKQFAKINKMTPQRLRTFEGFEQISDQEAQNFIEQMELFCEIIFNHIHQ